MASIFDIILYGTSGRAQCWVLPNVRGQGRERWIGGNSAEKLQRFADKHGATGFGSFFAVSTIREGKPRKKEFAVGMRFLFADLDFKHIDLTPEKILELLLALPFPPSRIHFTGHGYHCLWYLTDVVGPDGFDRAEALLKRIAYLLAGDVQVCHRVALLRLPGSVNSKYEKHKRVEVIRETAASYDLDDLERWLTAATVPVIAKRGAETNPFLQVADNQAARAPVDVRQRLQDMRVGGGDINGVHPSQLAVTASLTAKDMDEDEIVEIVLGATQQLDGTGGWNWFEEERAIRKMCVDMRKKIERQKDQERQPRSLSAAAPTANLADARKSRGDDMAEDIAPAYSDEALALRFTARYPNIRFTAAWNKWSIFDGTRWKTDETREVFSCARVVCREAARETNAAKAAKAIASSKTRSAVVSMVSDDRRVAATVDQWDLDPWLLNTPAGTVDLRSGEMRAHRLDDYMTKITAVSPDASCPTPIFDKFLDTVTRADEDYKAFLCRMSGYALTGSTRDHALFFLHGGGRNGKGTFVRTIGGIIGDYHATAPTEAFMDTKNERHPTELAMLRGARLVTSTETEEGRAWAESLIKKLTGGDPIDARFMRQDFFRYTPQFKLVMQGNHKPSLKTVDAAMRARLNLLPFTVTIPPEERDPELEQKLKAEWPGILAWMVQGCLDWQARGLAQPEVVTSATDTYLDDQDTVGRWVEECCQRDVNAFTLSRELYAAWDAWADAMGLPHMDGKRFSQRLEGMGFAKVNRPRQGGRGFEGIRGPMTNPNRSFVPRDNQGETAASIRMRKRRGGANGARA